MRTPTDQDVRDVISRTGLGQTLFVEAGAGSGKTSQLVDRIANLVLVHAVRLANVAAITFTEAAAAELQNRIRVRFEQRAAAATDPLELERCRTALAEADMAAISTLHGFANRLLGEFAVNVGLPPRVRVLDEVSSQLAHEQRWEHFVDALYDDPAHEELLIRAALLGVPLEPRYPGHATFKDVAAELNQDWDRLTTLVGRGPASLAPVDFSAFDAAVDEVVALPSCCIAPDDLLHVKLVGTLIPEMTAVRDIADPARKLHVLAAHDGWGPGSGGRAGNWPGTTVPAVKDAIRAVGEARSALLRPVVDDVLQHLLVLVAREVVDAAEARRREGALEFHDLLVLATELLRTDARVRSILHARYTHVLLDEFQDTDPIQIDLATLIATNASTDELAPWHDLDVDKGRLFFVGDPKQSIYRFRRADIALFLRARDRYGPGDTVARLTTNFRTVAPILDWVNALFTHTMPDEIAAKQPRYEELVAWRDADSGADHRPVLLGGPHPNPKVNAAELRELEAAQVAATIAHIRTDPDAWPVHDDATDDWRPARLSDVTILVPTRTSLAFLRAALESRDLPYRLATGTLVYDTQEVRDALSALQAIDDPSDQVSLVAALRSPLYACSDVDLFTYHDAGGRWDLRGAPPADVIAATHPVVLALDHLRGLWEQRWWLTPSALLDRLLQERHAALLAFGHPRPAEVWGRLRFLVDQARAFEEARGGGLRDFIAWAKLQSADSARVHEPLLPETDEQAVQILTIHGSKGLEFPITILSGMTTQNGGRRQGVSVLWNDDGPPEVRLRKDIETVSHEPRNDLELEMDAHEKLRLLYVATTRARDHLVVSCHHKAAADPTTTYAGRVWSFFADRDDCWRPAEWLVDDEPAVEPSQLDLFSVLDAPDPQPESSEPVAAPPLPVEALDDRDEWIARREAVLAPQRIPRVTSATAVARAAAALALADDDDDGADLDDDDERLRVRTRGRAGSAIGRAVHATLQSLDLTAPGDVEAVAVRQAELEGIADSVDTVVALVRSALGSDAVQLAAAHPHQKELFLAAPVGARVIEGYVDLLVQTPAGLVVVDYKTDTVRSEADVDAKLAAYELQGAAYALALQQATGLSVVDVRFVFCRAIGAIERSVSDLPTAIARVQAALTT
jgi:ATP-dependent helicase/nuclease subunit A